MKHPMDMERSYLPLLKTFISTAHPNIVLRFPNEIFEIAPSSTFVLESDEHVIIIPRNSRQFLLSLHF